MEEDVVLADEIVLFARAGFIHQSFQASFWPDELAPFDRGRKVADDGFEPDVDAFAVPAFHRDGDAPIQVTCDRTRFQAFAFDLAQRFAQDRITHVTGPLAQKILDFRL